MAVVHREWGVVHERGFGAFDRDRLFLIASSSKVLSAGILQRLADQKLLDLDAPIGNVVGGRWGDGKAGLTVAQLLSNSSGLVGLLDEAALPAVRLPVLAGGQPRRLRAGDLPGAGR